MTRLALWGIGLRSGAVSGICTRGVGVVLLAVRWAIEQLSGPAGGPFFPWWATLLPGLTCVLPPRQGYPLGTSRPVTCGRTSSIAVL